MKLDDAYNAWGQQSDNRELFQKTKTTFRKMWWLIPTNKPCSYYTLTVLGRALAQANGAHGDKVSAASVMCHVLNYAYQCDPEGMDKPRFGFSDIVNYEGTKPSPMVQAIESARGQVPDMSDADDTSVRGQVPDMNEADAGDADNGDAKGQSPDREPVKVQSPDSERPSPDIERPNDDEPLVRVKPAAKARREAELARRAGTTPKSVVQLDADTLKPIKVWKSCHAPQTELGIRNVQRAVERHGLAGGYYWCRPGDEESFKPADKRSCNGKHVRLKVPGSPQTRGNASARDLSPDMPITKEQRELHSKVFDRPTDGDTKHGDARGQSPDREPVKVQSPGIERPNTEHVEGVLQKCSQDELIAELRRRHWRGTLHITQTIEL